jgi:hypothetical protein
MTQRIFGMTAALALSDLFFHSADAFAASLRAETMAGRLGALLLALAIMVGAMIGARLWFPRSFFHGFIVATGVFLSIDIVLVHWIFQLHRITNGPEANVIEPILVVLGIVFLWFGIRNERGVAVAARP